MKHFRPEFLQHFDSRQLLTSSEHAAAISMKSFPFNEATVSVTCDHLLAPIAVTASTAQTPTAKDLRDTPKAGCSSTSVLSLTVSSYFAIALICVTCLLPMSAQ